MKKEDLLREIYKAMESGVIFEHFAHRGKCYDEGTNEESGYFVLTYVEVDGEHIPVIIHVLRGQYIITSPMFPDPLAIWVKASESGGFSGIEALGEIGDDDYISMSRIHGGVKRKLVAALPLI